MQYPAPTVAIQCTVNRAFVERYAGDRSSSIRLWTAGDGNYSGDRVFIRPGEVHLYPEHGSSGPPYRVKVDAALQQLIARACSEDTTEVIRYITAHEFDTEQNRFFQGHDTLSTPASAIGVGAWRLKSWNIDRASAFPR